MDENITNIEAVLESVDLRVWEALYLYMQNKHNERIFGKQKQLQFEDDKNYFDIPEIPENVKDEQRNSIAMNYYRDYLTKIKTVFRKIDDIRPQTKVTPDWFINAEVLEGTIDKCIESYDNRFV